MNRRDHRFTTGSHVAEEAEHAHGSGVSVGAGAPFTRTGQGRASLAFLRSQNAKRVFPGGSERKTVGGITPQNTKRLTAKPPRMQSGCDWQPYWEGTRQVLKWPGGFRFWPRFCRSFRRRPHPGTMVAGPRRRRFFLAETPLRKLRSTFFKGLQVAKIGRFKGKFCAII